MDGLRQLQLVGRKQRGRLDVSWKSGGQKVFNLVKSNTLRRLEVMLFNTDGLVDELRQSSWWEENDGVAWI